MLKKHNVLSNLVTNLSEFGGILYQILTVNKILLSYHGIVPGAERYQAQ